MELPLNIPHSAYIKSNFGWINVKSLRALIIKEVEDKFYEKIQHKTFINENSVPCFCKKLSNLYFRPNFTPEVKIRTNVADIINFLELSYINADHQMMIYLAKIIHLLFVHFNELGGCSQKKLFSILTNFSKRIIHLRHNTRIVRELLKTADFVLNNPENCVMSPMLLSQHQICLEKTSTYVDKKVADDFLNFSFFDNLPLHIIFNILKYVQNPEDLYNVRMTNKLFYKILSGDDVWKFFVHEIRKENQEESSLSPRHEYFNLLANQRESYLVQLNFCCRCSVFFWSVRMMIAIRMINVPVTVKKLLLMSKYSIPSNS